MFLSSCEETVSGGNKLSQNELDYLRQRATAECIAGSNKRFQDLAKASNDNMLNYVRENTWKYEYKKDSTVIETSHIYVWKVSPPSVYFRIRLSESGTVKNRFVKVDTSSNEDMMRNLQVQLCNKTLNVTGTSILNVKIETPKEREDADTLVDTVSNYTVSTAYPTFFSTMNYKKTKKSYNNKEVLQKTEVFEYGLTKISNTAQPASHMDPSIPNREYCVVKYADPTPPSTLDVYQFPFPLKCETSGPVDGNGDGTPDFDPDNELVL